MRRRHVVLALMLTAGCGFPTQDAPTPIAGEEQPVTPTTEANGGQPVVEAITVWFIQDDHLVPLTRRVTSPADAALAVASLAAGVTPAEGSRGVRSAIPDPSMITGTNLSRGTATVQLAGEFLDIPAGDQVAALGQIVFTLTDLRGVGRVRFEIEGEAVVVPLPSGNSTQDSVSRDDFAPLAATG